MDDEFLQLMLQQLLFGQQQAQQQVQNQQGFGIEDLLSLLGTDTALPSATSRAQISPIEQARSLLGTGKPTVSISQPRVSPGPVQRQRPVEKEGQISISEPRVVRPGLAGPPPGEGELMQLMMSALMDPDIKADDVGSQLMQMITVDSLTGNQRGGNTPQGVSGFLKDILANMAAEQSPNQGARNG